ncbi:MAG: hypothetical protein KUG77_17195 [Nannocystaceae bacterium]|nr:hypothetical protein [Nannocystaceae bacterium]
MLVGSAGGRIRTGNDLDDRTERLRNRWSRHIGAAYNWVLITCMLAMGVDLSD